VLGRTGRRRREAATHVVEEMIRGGGRRRGGGHEGKRRGDVVRSREVVRGFPGGKGVAKVLMAGRCGLPNDRKFSPCLIPTRATCPGKGPRSRRDIRFPMGL
jgi:hypothetical protein